MFYLLNNFVALKYGTGECKKQVIKRQVRQVMVVHITQKCQWMAVITLSINNSLIRDVYHHNEFKHEDVRGTADVWFSLQ